MSPVTLLTTYLSGVTSPLTRADPSPTLASIAITDRSPVSGLRVNSTPELRDSSMGAARRPPMATWRSGRPQPQSVSDGFAAIKARPARAQRADHGAPSRARRDAYPAVPRNSLRRCLPLVALERTRHGRIRVGQRLVRVGNRAQQLAGQRRGRKRPAIDSAATDTASRLPASRRSISPRMPPEGSAAASATSKAAVVTMKPGGTVMPARVSSPRTRSLARRQSVDHRGPHRETSARTSR